MTRRVFHTVGADGRHVARAVHEPGSDVEDETFGASMSKATADVYRRRWGRDRDLVTFRGQNDFRYLFDLSSFGEIVDSVPADRVVAAWGASRPDRRIGSRNAMRRFPLPTRPGQPLDRGHLISLAMGGGENVNLVPQASRLNRGWSEQGKRWRALERLAERTVDLFVYIEVLYDDLTDVPSGFTYRIFDNGEQVADETFRNRDT